MKSANLTLSPHFWKSLGAYHLHGKSGNCGWKIQWFAPFRLKRFRISGDAILLPFFNLFCWFEYFIHCSGSFSHHVKFYSFIFCTRFFTRVVCVIGKHPLNNKCTAILTYIVNDKQQRILNWKSRGVRKCLLVYFPWTGELISDVSQIFNWEPFFVFDLASQTSQTIYSSKKHSKLLLRLMHRGFLVVFLWFVDAFKNIISCHDGFRDCWEFETRFTRFRANFWTDEFFTCATC